MKFLHISDLHLGRKEGSFSLIEDQDYILHQILAIVDAEHPDALLIAGDVYDKPLPTAEAVELLDGFLVQMAQRKVPVLLISGNHDSAERLAFGGRLMDASGVHISPVYTGKAEKCSFTDAYGTVDVYLLPFLKPSHVRRWYEDEEINTYTDAVRTAIAHMELNPAHRNVLVTHQFVTGSVRSDSEEISVGGTDHVDADVFADFDYVALGHLHSPQHCGQERIRYCGTPLKYSFSEARDRKSVTVAELQEKGCLRIRTVPLTPLRDMVELRGTFAELTAKDFYENTPLQEDYTHLILTDEEDIPDAIGKLRMIYRGLMVLDYDNQRTRMNAQIDGTDAIQSKSPLELFADFYTLQNNLPMNEEQEAYMKNLIERIWEEEA